MARKYVDADSMGKGSDPLTGRACESVDGCARGWWPPARAGSMQAAGEAEQSSVQCQQTGGLGHGLSETFPFSGFDEGLLGYLGKEKRGASRRPRDPGLLVLPRVSEWV